MNNNWQSKKLGDIATIKRGGSPRPIQDYLVDKEESGYNWLKIGDVQAGNRYIYSTSAKIKSAGLTKTTLVKKGELILSNSMSFGRPYIMMTDACIHDGWLALQDIDDTTDKQFLYYLLTTTQMQNRFKNYSAGSGVQNLKKQTVQQIAFRAPSKPEQVQIVNILAKWDDYIEMMYRQIAMKEQLKVGLQQQLLSGKRRMSGFTSAWKRTTLGAVSTKIEGGGTPAKDEQTYWNGAIPWASVKDIVSFNAYDTRDHITEEGLRHSSSSLVPAGTLITPTRMALGHAVFFNVDVAINQDLKAIYTSEKLNSKYLYYWFELNRKRIQRLGNGSTVTGIQVSELKSQEILLPRLDEQLAIVEVLDSISTIIAGNKYRLSVARTQRGYLLENLVVGKIRVPENLSTEEEKEC